MSSNGSTYAVEHLDPEVGEWSKLEYLTIAAETSAIGAEFWLTSFKLNEDSRTEFQSVPGLVLKEESVEKLFATQMDRVCLLDPASGNVLQPADGGAFDVFLFGGILGDDPPRDRTSELRKMGFPTRNLGPKQMTTDTAVRVTRTVIDRQVKLQDLEYIDDPELSTGPNESVQMPFRYVKDKDGKPVMPGGMLELIKKDSEKSIDDLF